MGQELPAPFDGLNAGDWRWHLQTDRYNDLYLPDAVRPNWVSELNIREGYLLKKVVDFKSGDEAPAIIAAVSRKKLLSVFLRSIGVLGKRVGIAMTSLHDGEANKTTTCWDNFNTWWLARSLQRYEDVLIDDGNAEVNIFESNRNCVVGFDEHKLLFIINPVEEAHTAYLEDYGVYQCDEINWITEDTHVHCSCDGYHQRYRRLVNELNAKQAKSP